MAEKITKRKVENLTPGEGGKRAYLWDSEVRGFGAMVLGSGLRVFVFKYRLGSKQRWFTIGSFASPWTVETARKKARALAAVVDSGRDPQSEAEASRNMPTFGAWAAEYLEGLNKKSIREDRRYLLTVAKRWHGQPLDSITGADANKLFLHVSKNSGKTTGNRALASWRACFAAAWRQELIDSNPCSRVRANPEPQPRERVLNQEELERFFDAVDAMRDPFAHAAFRLLIGTGARLSELLHARWEDIDLNEALWRLPDTKSGKVQRITLTQDLVDILRKLPRHGPYLLPGRDPSKPRADLKTAWRKLCEAAQLENLHIHDLRRSYGLLVAQQVGIRAASRVLRHSDIRVTSNHYAPFLQDEAREIGDKVAQVLPFKRKQEVGG